MPVQQQCRVVEMARLNPATWWMTLEVGKLAEQQGLRGSQFLHIKCGDHQLLRRPISVALVQWDEPQDTASLVFEVRGEGTEWLSRRTEGDILDVLGPLGNGFQMEDTGRYLLVGGGIGVPPLLGCAASGGERTTSILGFRSKDRAILIDRFQETGSQVLLCSDDGTLGEHCFVDALVRKALEQPYDGVLACGPKPMLKSVAKAAAEAGVPCQVSMEERMACGVGACLGCAVQMADGTMKHVCKDGPVFAAGEVDWNV